MSVRTVPTLGPIRRDDGVAGQVAYTVRVSYDSEPTSQVAFVGSVYGGPVVMVSASTPDGGVLVHEPDRFGVFGPEWVRRFFA